jgi:hypothetical protein
LTDTTTTDVQPQPPVTAPPAEPWHRHTLFPAKVARQSAAIWTALSTALDTAAVVVAVGMLLWYVTHHIHGWPAPWWPTTRADWYLVIALGAGLVLVHSAREAHNTLTEHRKTMCVQMEAAQGGTWEGLDYCVQMSTDEEINPSGLAAGMVIDAMDRYRPGEEDEQRAEVLRTTRVVIRYGDGRPDEIYPAEVLLADLTT